MSAEPQGELANECDSVWRIRNMNWAGWWRTPSWLSMHLAGWFFRGCFFVPVFFLYCSGPMDFPMQPLQFKQIQVLINSDTMRDKIEGWQSIYVYCIHIYIYIYNPSRIIIVILNQHHFYWGRRVSLSWREIGKSNFRFKQGKWWLSPWIYGILWLFI